MRPPYHELGRIRNHEQQQLAARVGVVAAAVLVAEIEADAIVAVVVVRAVEFVEVEAAVATAPTSHHTTLNLGLWMKQHPIWPQIASA